MTFPAQGSPRDDEPRPDALPGAEPADPWAEEEAARRQQEAGWVAESGGMGPIPARTWSRGNSRITVGGCCLPLPIGCLTTVVAAGLVAAKLARRGR
jgi:hypothetical protein